MVDQPALRDVIVPPALPGSEGRSPARLAGEAGAKRWSFLSRHSVEAWLLLLPSIVLLATFTHIPIISTLIDSFYSTPKASRPSRFVGLS
ncbi:MAG: hypothetical protein ACHQAY_24570, partial [Hyphomicrobiales bacterium]